MPQYPGMFAAAGFTPYEPNAVVFDGADWLHRSTQLTGAVDSKEFTLVMSIKFGALNISQHLFNLSDTNGMFDQCVVRMSSARMNVQMDNAAGTRLADLFDNNPGYSTGVWYTFTLSANLGTGSFWGYRSDLDIFGSPSVSDDEVDFTVPEAMVCSREPAGDDIANLEMADLRFWVGTGKSMDFSVEGNRRLFHDASGCLVEPASDGAITGLGAPIVFLGGPSDATDWHLDRSGNGNDYTVAGALTDSGDPPCGA